MKCIDIRYIEIHGGGPFHQRVLLTRDKGFTPLYARSARFSTPET